MPVPVLVNAPVPLITPENVVEVLLPPVVSVLAPSVTVPLPAREPIVSSALSDSLAPEDTVTAQESLMALPPVSESVPRLTVVPPAYVLAPLRVTPPEPAPS